jgi:glycosyltransferase A (GT-A) superfamily protein (DUF2064 family)
MTAGKLLWDLATGIILAVAVLGLAADIGIWLIRGAPATITDYLRANPWAFWRVVILFNAILIVLGVHLFALPRLMK